MRGDVYRDVVQWPVSIELANGEILFGTIEKPRSKTLIDFLNDSEIFVIFQDMDGDQRCLSKRSIVGCTAKSVPKAEQLGINLVKTDIYHPFSVLGLPTTADREALRIAYHGMARIYHPDRFQGLDLPKEMADYASEMAKRINIAYGDAKDLLDAGERKAKASATGAGWTKRKAGSEAFR